MNISEEASKRIQICRAVAIIAVVIIHNLPMSFYSATIRLFVNFCVALFIFLSGFLTVNKISVKKIQKRLFRVIIPYVFWSIIYTLINNNFSAFIFNLVTGQCCSIYYYILVYIQLTILIPVFIRIMNTRRWKIILWISPIAILIEYILIKNNIAIVYPWNANNFFVWVSFFYLGLCIRNNKININKIKNKYLVIFGCTAFGLNLSEMIFWLLKNDYNMATTQIKITNFLFSVFICLLLVKWINSDKKIIQDGILKKCLINLGDCSFGIYLSHLLIMQILQMIIYKYFTLFFPLNVILVIILSMLIINCFKNVFGNKVSKIVGFI